MGSVQPTFKIRYGNPSSMRAWRIVDGVQHEEWLVPLGRNMDDVFIDAENGDIYVTQTREVEL